MEFLSKINTYIDIDNNCLIIWISHDKDFINGCFYKIDMQNKKILYCILKNIDYNEVEIGKL